LDEQQKNEIIKNKNGVPNLSTHLGSTMAATPSSEIITDFLAA
jgi:hypothetical protein